jgi:hypothetical protein
MKRVKDVQNGEKTAQYINWFNAKAHPEQFQAEQAESKNYRNARPAQRYQATGDL